MEIGHQCMAIWRSIMTHAMYQSQDDPGNVDDGNSTNRKDAGAKYLFPFLWRGGAEDQLDDQHIAKENAGTIYN